MSHPWDDQPEWIDWTPEVAANRPDLVEAVESFEAPDKHPAGAAAAAWLRDEALGAYKASRTRLLVYNGVVQGFYSLSMAEVELRPNHRKKLGESHVRQGAVLITWLAKSAEATLPDVGEILLLHAVAKARHAAQEVGATVLALDPYDATTAAMWQKRGFRNSLTGVDGKPRRLWTVLFPR